MAYRPPDWKVGDPVYAAWSERGGPYSARGLGRVIRIEPPYLMLATKSGPERRVGMTDLYQFTTREECEACVKELSRPSGHGKPMAHYGPDDGSKR